MENTTTPTKPINVEDVVSVYVGREGCRCGCLGNYTYASAHRQHASTSRGYKVNDDEVNDKRIRRVVKWVNEHLADVTCIYEYIFDVKYSERTVYTVYLKKPNPTTRLTFRVEPKPEIVLPSRFALEMDAIEL